MRTRILTPVPALALIAALITIMILAPAALAQDEDMTRAFGITLGEPLRLSSKQVQAVQSPGNGLERLMLLFTPGALPPYARHFATVDVATKRVAAMTGITRRIGSEKEMWKVFNQEIKRLEDLHGPGMRLGGGGIWKIVRDGTSITLMLDPQQRKVSIRFADERRMKLASPWK